MSPRSTGVRAMRGQNSPKMANNVPSGGSRTWPTLAYSRPLLQILVCASFLGTSACSVKPEPVCDTRVTRNSISLYDDSGKFLSTQPRYIFPSCIELFYSKGVRFEELENFLAAENFQIVREKSDGPMTERTYSLDQQWDKGKHRKEVVVVFNNNGIIENINASARDIY